MRGWEHANQDEGDHVQPFHNFALALPLLPPGGGWRLKGGAITFHPSVIIFQPPRTLTVQGSGPASVAYGWRPTRRTAMSCTAFADVIPCRGHGAAWRVRGVLLPIAWHPSPAHPAPCAVPPHTPCHRSRVRKPVPAGHCVACPRRLLRGPCHSSSALHPPAASFQTIS